MVRFVFDGPTNRKLVENSRLLGLDTIYLTCLYLNFLGIYVYKGGLNSILTSCILIGNNAHGSGGGITLIVWPKFEFRSLTC